MLKMLHVTALLTGLSLASGACTRTAAPQVVVVPMTCPLGPLPQFPALTTAHSCGVDTAGVPVACLGVPDLDALFLWARAVQRWAEMAQVCLDVNALGPSVAPTPAPEVGWTPSTVLLSAMAAAVVVERMTLPGMAVTWDQPDCDGQFNAAYDLTSKMVHVCTSVLRAGPELTRFVVAHEMAHAMMDQLDLPYTGSGEAAADELAALYAIATDSVQDVNAAADLFWLDAELNAGWWDDHQNPGQRSRILRCFAAGAAGLDWMFDCRVRLARAARAWARILP